MNGIRLIGALAVFLVATGATAQAPQDVNVVNTPGVNVTNDAADPVLVRGVEDTSRAFQKRLILTIPAGRTQEQVNIDVPAGKRLVFEHVSARVQGPIGQSYIMHIQTSLFANGSGRGIHWLALNKQMTTSSVDVFTTSQPMRIYAETSTPPALLIVTRTGAAGESFAEATISGYLVDLPSP